MRNHQWLALCVVVAGVGVGGCDGTDESDDVVVQQPGQFQSVLPAGWRVLIPSAPGSDPGETDIELVPVFSAYSPDHPGVTFAVFDEASTDLEAAGEEWRERVAMELSQFERHEDGGRVVLDASGSGEFGSRAINMDLALVAFPSAKQSWVLQCTVQEESDKEWCGRLFDGFGPSEP